VDEPRTSWTLKARCASCDAELPVEPDRRFVDCPHCNASSILDLGGAATCFALKETVDHDGARDRLMAWLRTHEVRDGVEIVEARRLLVPYWVLGSSAAGWATLASERADLPLPRSGRAPAGQLEHVDPDEGHEAAEVLEPTMPLAAARAHFAARQGGDAATSLVFVPFLQLAYTFRGASYEAFVDIASGEVHGSLWPRVGRAKHELRIAGLVGLALVAYTGVAATAPGAVLTTLGFAVVSAGLYWLFRRFVRAEDAHEEPRP
jgi:hypothetical protein